MTLVWKLLRRHISVSQFIGFAFANLFGMMIVLLGYQFYRDVIPVFTSQDSFMKANYVIINKKVGAASTLASASGAFTNSEIDDLARQKFVKQIGSFTSAEYRVDARMSVDGQPIISSELFFESVPDGFIDVPLSDWKYVEGSKEVPVILPRSYINMYNFGFARSRSLPKISEGLIGLIDFRIFITGNGRRDEFKGRAIGFSGRLNTILVPQSFMDWSNSTYAPERKTAPTRLVVEMSNPADDNVAKYFGDKGYDVDQDKLQAEKTAYFLRLAVTVVMAIGGVISVLSFYILMLSIYLLVQKNSSKLENLLLIGYSPFRVALPYEILTLVLNAVVLLVAIIVVSFVREYYMEIIETLFPRIAYGSMMPSVFLGLSLFIIISAVNQLAIYHKVKKIWYGKDL